MKKNNKHSISKGFTLIELLVVLVVLMSTGMVIGAILFSTLRGASKASILTTARQNGEYAISQMVKTIRNAKSFGGVGECDPRDTTNCDKDWVTDCSQTGSTKYQHVKITGPDDGDVVYSCVSSTISSGSAVLGSGFSLIDDSLVQTNTTDKAKDTFCHFTCLQSSPSDSPTIGINFSLMQKEGGSTLVEKTVLLPFSTSVRMRNSLR